MWIDELDDDDAAAIFGSRAAEIRDAIAGRGSSDPLGVVRMLLVSLDGIVLERNVGRWSPRDRDVERVDDDDPVLLCPFDDARAQEAWRAATEGEEPHLDDCIALASHAAVQLASHWLTTLLAGAACELLKMPQHDHHAFLELLPWLRAGHRPLGWRDDTGRAVVW